MSIGNPLVHIIVYGCSFIPFLSSTEMALNEDSINAQLFLMIDRFALHIIT